MHIFFIHSHITYVVAQLFILEHKLNKNGVRYIVSRGYELKGEEKKAYDITDFYNYLESRSRLSKLFGLRSKLKKIDNEIAKLSENQTFNIYLPQFNHSLFQILATHRLCKKTILVEEGITAYKADIKLYAHNQKKMAIEYFLAKIISKRFILNNGHYSPFPKQKFEFAICISENCFPFIETKKVLALNNKIIENFSNTTEEGNIIFVLDSFMERTKITEEEYLMTIKGTLQLIKNNENKLFIKFHPEQNQYIRDKTVNFINGNFNFKSLVCLNDNCILEFEFLKSKNLTIIGMHSSLLFYAKRFGHHVLSGAMVTTRLSKVNAYVDHVMDKKQKEELMSYV
ncbi:MAG: polysialyltransferase family glycosyltransferase [Flavobacteriaceae bacterium]